jgi:hypothetical protein
MLLPLLVPERRACADRACAALSRRSLADSTVASLGRSGAGTGVFGTRGLIAASCLDAQQFLETRAFDGGNQVSFLLVSSSSVITPRVRVARLRCGGRQ